MDLLTASLDEEFIELVNATLGRWMPARVRNMSYSDYFNVLCPLMCSEAVCDYFKKRITCPLGSLLSQDLLDQSVCSRIFDKRYFAAS